MKTAVVAVGGNSLIIDRDHKSIPDQYEAASRTVQNVVDMIQDGWNVVLTHGNGPQVGFVLRRSEMAIEEVPPVPMDYAGADIQGAVGYMFQRAFRNEFHRRGLALRAVAIVTEVRVDSDDPAFAEPTKPIGSHMDQEMAERLADRQGWTVREDAGRGWRRVVPSPEPLEILSLDAIQTLLSQGYVVIACGGGGIPVVADDSGLIEGVEAVIDKDLASSRLARDLGAEMLVISTAVERVALHFGTPEQQWLDTLTAEQARDFSEQGHFLAGSMGPKVRAMIEYIEGTGDSDRRGLITNPESLRTALKGKAGTWFIRESV